MNFLNCWTFIYYLYPVLFQNGFMMAYNDTCNATREKQFKNENKKENLS